MSRGAIEEIFSALLEKRVEEPLPFAELADAAARVPLGSITVPIASIPHLMRMKRAAGRAQDLEDLRVLEELLRARLDDTRG